MAGQLPALHSPTSVASPNEDPVDEIPLTESVRSGTSGRRGLNGDKSKKEEVVAIPPTDADSSPVRSAPRRQPSQEPCPEVITGSRMQKPVKLPPNIWVKIGRQPKATLLISDPGVSRDQCSFKWDRYQRKVELRNDNGHGNYVNGVEVQEARLDLQHGDRVRIIGKTQPYEFLVDLRPVGLGFGDPRYVIRDKASRDDPEKRNVRLREQLHTLELEIKKRKESNLQLDQEFYEIEMQRRLRKQEMEEKDELLKFYIEDTERLKEELEEKRQRWLERLEEEYRANQEEYMPLVQHLADLQDKLEKLQLKKDELARSIHPERYAVADVAMELPSPAISDRGSTRSIARGEDSGEEDAFAGLSGLEDNREASDVEDKPPVKTQPKAEAAEEPTKVLKRESGEDSGEPAAKQPRLHGDEREEQPSTGSATGGLEGRVLD